MEGLNHYAQAVTARSWRDGFKCIVQWQGSVLSLEKPVDPPSRWSRLLGSTFLYKALWGTPKYRNDHLTAQTQARSKFIDALRDAYGTQLADRTVKLFIREDSALVVNQVRDALRYARESSPYEANLRLISRAVKDHVDLRGHDPGDFERRLLKQLGTATTRFKVPESLVVNAARLVMEEIRLANTMAATDDLTFSSEPVPPDNRPADEILASGLEACARGLPDSKQSNAQTRLRRIIDSAPVSKMRAAEILQFAASSSPLYREHIVNELCHSQRGAFDDQGVTRHSAFRALMPARYSQSRIQTAMAPEIHSRLTTPPVEASRGFEPNKVIKLDSNRAAFCVNGKRLPPNPEDPEVFISAFRGAFGPTNAQNDMLATLASRFMTQTNTTQISDILREDAIFPLVKDSTSLHEAERQDNGTWALTTTYRCTIAGAMFPDIDGPRALKQPVSILYTISCTLVPGIEDAAPSVSDIRTDVVFTSDRPPATR